MGASVDALSATIEATTAEEAEVEDAGTTAALAKSGMTSLARTAGRASLVRAPGGISLARRILRASLAFLYYLHHQEGMMTTSRTRGLGASESLVPTLAS